MNFEAVIGLEIHVEMKTRSKMFSSSPNSFSRAPNTEVTPFDMAFPGTMPRLNKEAVRMAIRVANALHMKIDRELHFDRKNYFYPDLPKGFQITQQRRPFGSDGYLEIRKGNGKKRIGIERIHMEEDTCKQTHFVDYTLLDYNRAGVPLVEIVSRPEMHDGYEAMKYVEAIRNIVVYSGTSDGKMEEGSLRVDVNISLRPYGAKEFGTKVEIKNLNSLKNIQDAIDFEIERQSAALLSGEKIQQETRRYDESKGATVLMRVKTDAVDYKYFPEPNLVPIKLSEAFVEEAIATCPELYDSKFERYLAMGLTEKDAEIILSDPAMAAYFEAAAPSGADMKEVANFLIVEVNSFLNKTGQGIGEIKLPSVELGKLTILLKKENLTHKQGADILFKCLEDGLSPEEAKKALHIEAMVDDEGAILAFVTAALDANPQSIADYKAGKDRAISFLVGQVMKLSKGKAKPSSVMAKLKEEIAKR